MVVQSMLVQTHAPSTVQFSLVQTLLSSQVERLPIWHSVAALQEADFVVLQSPVVGSQVLEKQLSVTGAQVTELLTTQFPADANCRLSSQM